MSDPTHQAIVIGAGFAGLSAAVELSRLGVATALVDDGYSGGLITNVGLIDAPGPYEGLAGADITGSLLGEALEAGADYHMGSATALTRTDGLWTLPELEIAAPAIVLATGAQLRRLDVPGEEALTGLGVSQCAFCDGGLYTGQHLAVVGGGDAAFQEALHLAEIGCTVTMLLRGPTPRARQTFVDRAIAAPALTIRHQVEVAEVIGKGGVGALRLTDRQSGQTETLPLAAVFVFIGLEPQTTLAPPDAARDAAGALLIAEDCLTAAPGLYAIGAARAGYGGTLEHASADARAAAGAIAGMLG